MSLTGATKSHIQWVFEPISPNEIDAFHDFRNYWPGDEYVDWLSLDGYNSAGGQQWYQPWECFDRIYFIIFEDIVDKGEMLYKLREWRPQLPVMISELASYSVGGTRLQQKGQWLSDMVEYLASQSI